MRTFLICVAVLAVAALLLAACLEPNGGTTYATAELGVDSSEKTKEIVMPGSVPNVYIWRDSGTGCHWLLNSSGAIMPRTRDESGRQVCEGAAPARQEEEEVR